MSLTEEALYERKWRRFPELGKLLSRKQLGLEWTGPSSVSDNIFDQVHRLLEMYAIVEENSKEIEQATAGAEHSIIGDSIREELLKLSEGLSWAAERFTNASNSVEKLARRGPFCI